MNLEQLPGVGPQLADRIRRHMGSDEAFYAAAENMDLQAISSVDGLSERRAVDLVLAARGNHVADAFLATPAARRVHDRIMARLLRYASTDAGRNRLRLLHPLPNQESATRHAARVMEAKAAMQGVDFDAARACLRAIQGFRQPPPTLDTGLLVVAETDQTYNALHRKGVSAWATLGTPRDLAAATDYDVVVIAYDEGSIDAASLPNAIDVPADAPLAALCPHSILDAFAHNQAAIQACAQLAELLDRPSVASQALEHSIQSASTTMDAATIRRNVDTIKTSLDAQLEALVSDLQLSGPDMLRAMSKGALPSALQGPTQQVLTQARNLLREATGIAFQPYTAGLPLGIDEDEIERVCNEQQAGQALQSFKAQQAAAEHLQKLLPEIHDEMRAWLEWDATCALGRFALDHRLEEPVWSDDLRFEASVHLDLAHTASAQRIRYRIGGHENVAVLTGANSGGKSTLLEHLCQIVIMARMGLPVVGEHVQVPWLDEIHLVTARRGMDAGAFETFLRGFLPVTQGNAKRLVLADEVESVTELEAAGRIIAFVLDRLAASQSMAVVVTHLAPQVMAFVRDATVRMDGIEATGLDDQHRLIVDRQPKLGHQARSTPELIVQRLAATVNGAEKQLYIDLLECFNGRHA